MRPLKIVIVDDEAPARENLRMMLAAHSACTICGECATSAQATSLIARTRPDLVLLDIEMPGISGADLAASLKGPDAPLVVFVTAHVSHAVRAFDLGAVDYLLKPFSEQRLARALERVVERATQRDKGLLAPRVEALARQLDAVAGLASPPRLVVREGAFVHYASE